MPVLQALSTMITIWDGNYNVFVSCTFTENQVKVRLTKGKVQVAKGRGVEYTWIMTWTFSLPVSQSTYKPPDFQYMERQLKMWYRVKETGKLQWFKGHILNYDLPQVSIWCSRPI